MKILITTMVIFGSVLMIINIIRYVLFLKKLHELERGGGKPLYHVAPLALLVFFLLAYAAVGIFGLADILIASILLLGSLFVFLFLSLILSIVDRVRDTDRVLSARYEEMKAELSALTSDANATFLINLTADEVEERDGQFLYDSDLESVSYTELLERRRAYMIDLPNRQQSSGPRFTRDALLQAYQEGQTRASEVILARRRDGECAFVRFEATMTKKPVSGDVVAFVIERPFNEQVVRRVLLERVLMDQYDRIVYLSDGICRVLISNIGKKKGLLFRTDETDTYESLYLNEVLPTLDRDRYHAEGPNPLRLTVVEKALAENDTYLVELPFVIDGVSRRKRFTFYCVDRKAKFYLMLLSDIGTDGEPPSEDAPGLPAAVPALPNEEEPSEAAPETAAEEARFGEGLRVLAADDNAMNREIAELLLSSEGFEVDLAADGAEAVQRVSDAPPGTYDLILMDVHMPGMDGYAATAAIRALPDPQRAGVYIVALSAADAEEDVRAALAAGMDAYATKPLDPDRLRELMDGLPRCAGADPKQKERSDRDE